MADLTTSELTVEFSSGGYVVRPIDRLDLHVPSGRTMLLLGASGSGKTTLLSVLARILRPTRGRVRLGDTVVTDLEGRELTQYRRERVGIVFQAFNLVPSLTALENVSAPLQLAGARGARARARATALLERVDLADRMHHRPGDLSGGQQQRVAIARALVHDPPLLLADEPTAHLDYVQVEGVLRLLGELAGPDRVVLVATHDERLLPVADGVIDLSPGTNVPAPRAGRRTLAAGEVVFAQGEVGDLVYRVEDGEVELVRERSDGSEEKVAVLGPGCYFGELAPVFGLRRSATARALGPAEVRGMGVIEFRASAAAGARPGDAS